MSHLYPRPSALQIAQTKYISGINGLAVANTTIFTTDAASGRYFPALARIVLKTVVALVTPPQISIGTNSPNFNNIMPLTLLTGLTTAEDFFPYMLAAVSASVAPGTAVVCRVGVVGTATTYTVQAQVLGDYAP